MANSILYGFTNLQDLKNSRVEEVGVGVVDDAITKTLDEHNRQLNTMLSLFAIYTTEYKKRFKSAVNNRLQPLDQNGRALPVKSFGQYDIALPLQMGGTAWGANYVTAQKMTVADVENRVNTMIMGDINWMRDHLLAALFLNVLWTFTDDEHGDLMVKGLANADTDTYQIMTGGNAPEAADHYLAQSAAISDAANPFKAIYNKLIQHPENSGDVIVLVASNLVGDIENLANFKERSDANISQGANQSRLIGTLTTPVPGRVIGYVDKCWIVEWSQLPSGYMVATTTDGDKPIAIREDNEQILRGFKKVAERNDHPFYESQYLRRAGFGAWNRVGAVVYKIGSAGYSVPTGFESPMR